MIKPTALVTASAGIGDILRVTPLIKVLSHLGYEVDVLISPDYLDTMSLLQGAPEIRDLFCIPPSFNGDLHRHLQTLTNRVYDIATFTYWSFRLRQFVRSQKILSFTHYDWFREGDIPCVKKIAGELGWNANLPAPFAIASQRTFGLKPNTIALHPGCKRDWPWKKWHGFEDLARMFPEVVILGTPSDLLNNNTYFKKTFTWPPQAINVVGKLNLPDTAALLRECAALVTNDSGLMHLSVAVGTTTFGIFGLTNPHREAIPSDKMVIIGRKVPCESRCWRHRWGDWHCDFHLQCLKLLSAEEVFDIVSQVLPGVLCSGDAAFSRTSESPKQDIQISR